MQCPNRSKRASILAAAVAAALAAGAQAEEQLENIVVTAQGRTQSERDVPIAMDVITVQQIESLGAVNLSDLNGFVPGLQVDGSQPTQPNFALRGIGTTDFGIGTDAPVGVYMDGIYTGKTGGSLMNFNDVQRVEVLKGPQGTIFGRNSAAGAISITSNEPDAGALDANGLVRYGRYQTYEFQGMLNVPLSETTAVRLAAQSKNSVGWLTDQTTGERFGGAGDWGLRGSFKWAPDAETKVVTTWEHESLDQAARAVFSLAPVTPGSQPPVPPDPATFINPLTSPLQNDAPNRETRTFDGLSLRFEAPLWGLKFSSTTAYRHFISYNGEDNDGTSNYATYLSTINEETNSSIQQEFRLNGKSDRVDWTAGMSFFHSDAEQTSVVNSTTDSMDTLWANSPGLLAQTGGFPLFLALDAQFGVPGLGLGLPWQERMVNSNRTNSYAVYGNSAWHLTPSTDLEAGLRATRDSKQVSWWVPPYSAPGLDAQFEQVSQLAFGTPMTFGQVTGINNIVFNGAAQLASQAVSAKRSWSDLSPRLALDHHFGPDTMVYASVAKGYQSGGYDVFSPLASFEPEHMINVEIGIKDSFPALHAGYEASVFHYKFNNLQNITLVTHATSLPSYDVTTSDQHAIGLDLSGHVGSARGVSGYGAVELMRQNYGTYSVQDGNTVDVLNGQPVGTPLLNLMLGVRYGWDLAGGHSQLVLQGAHESATRCNAHLVYSFECVNNGNLQTGSAQTIVSTRVGWTTGDHRFGAAVLVNNLFNKQYVSVPDGGGESAYTLGTPYGSVSEPRTYMVEFSASL